MMKIEVRREVTYFLRDIDSQLIVALREASIAANRLDILTILHFWQTSIAFDQCIRTKNHSLATVVQVYPVLRKYLKLVCFPECVALADKFIAMIRENLKEEDREVLLAPMVKIL